MPLMSPESPGPMDRIAAAGRMMTIAAVMLVIIAGCSGATAGTRQEAAGTALHADSDGLLEKGPNSWKIEYTLTGGFAGVRRHLVISSSGSSIATDERKGRRIERTATSEELAAIAENLSQLERSGMPEDRSSFSRPCADCFQHSLAIVIDGKTSYRRMNDLSLSDSPYASLIGGLSSMLQQMLSSAGPATK